MTQSLPVHVTTSSSEIVIPGIEGKVIEVVGLFFQCSSATTLTIKSNSLTFTGPMQFNIGGGLNLVPFANVYFQTLPGEGLIFDLTGLTGSVAGNILFNQQ